VYKHRVINFFLLSDKQEVVYSEFDIIKRSLQCQTWFGELTHFALVSYHAHVFSNR